jgi:nucleoside-diphosphate-sugar epimerase
VPCEAVFETHPDVSRAAVVGIGAAPDQTPVAIIQPQAWAPSQQRRLSTELLELASRHQVTKPITRLVFRRSLPVDVRHNSKINREQLAAWAGTKCAQALQPPASSLQPPASLMHTLVTGGGGFLGRYIVEQLVARGDRVRSFGRGEYPELAALGVEVVRGDIRDRDAVAEACRDTQCVIHAAAIAGIGGPWRRFYETNVLGTENVLAACRAHGVQRLVFTGSPSAVFAGKDQCGIDESAPYSLEWLQRHAAHYSRSKALAEQMVLSTNESGRLATCAVRPHLVWGPRDVHLIPRLLARARRGRLRRVGDGTNLVDITFVENAAAAHLAAADSLAEASSPAAGRAYFISQGEPVNCWQWIDDVLQLAELPPVARSLSFRAAWGIGAGCEAAYRLAGGQREPPMTRFLSAQLARSHWFDICAARRDLGYEPRISTAEGMRRLGDWLRQPA